MKCLKVGALSVGLAIVLTGCISKHSGVEFGEDVSYTIGKTTAREMVERWGNPMAIRNKVWIWRSSTSLGGRVRASYMALGATVSSQKASINEYRLTFDEQNILRDVEVLESLPGGPGWTIFPWY